MSIAAAFALPAWQRTQRTTRARAALADIRQFASAFQAYAHDHGDWPVACRPGDMPAGLESPLANTRWRNRTPIGGRYVWLVDTVVRGERIHAAISLSSAFGDRVSDDRRQLDELVRLAPEVGIDGNRLRLGYRNEPVYVLEH